MIQGYYTLIGPQFFEEMVDTSNATTTSGTDAQLASMTVTPPAGSYLCNFSTSITNSAAGSATSVSFYIAGTQKAASLIKSSVFDGGTLSATSARGSVAISTIVTVGGTDTIEIRWSVSSGTATCGARILNIVRLN